MLENLNLRLLNELKLNIETDELSIPIEWFHAVRNNDFCNPKWHAHSSIELHCVLDGRDEFTLPDGDVSVQAGQCLLIPPKLTHRRNAPQQSQLLKYSINFSILPKAESAESSFLQSAFHCENFRLFLFSREAQQEMELCLREANARQYGFVTNIQLHLLSSLIFLSRELSDHPKANYSVRTNQVINDERYKIIEKYMLTNLDKPLTVQDLTRTMNLSSKQLGRIVAASSDYRSVSSLLLNLRLERAKELLRQPELSIADVAKAVGFSTEYYFNRVFRREVGLPPGRYRKSLRAL